MMKSLLVAMTLVIGGIAFGQKSNTPQQNADKLTEAMSTKLELSADQKARIFDINRGIAMKNDGIRQSTQFTPDQKREIILSNYEAAKSMYKPVLTEAQYTKFEQMEKTRLEKKKSTDISLSTDELDNL